MCVWHTEINKTENNNTVGNIKYKDIFQRLPMCFLLPLLFCIAPSTHAQPVSNDEPLTILITSGRLENSLTDTPASISVIDQKSLKDNHQQLSLGEMLTSVPGVFTLNRYNFAQDLRVSIRGQGARANFGIRGIRVLVDGIPATTPDGQTTLDDIDLASLKRIEVIRGPAGALYGPASGGILSLETKPQGNNTPKVLGSVTKGAYGFKEYRLEGGNVVDDLTYSLNISHMAIDGYRTQSAAERDLFNARAEYFLSDDHSVTATFSILDSPLGHDPGGLTSSEVDENPTQASPINVRFDTGERVHQQRFGLTSHHLLNHTAELRLRGYYVHRDFSNRLPFNAIELNRHFGGIGVEYIKDSSWFNTSGRTLLGIDVDLQDDDRKRRDNLDGIVGELNFHQREEVTNVGVFISREHSLSEQLRLDMGLRYDHLQIKSDDRFIIDGDDSDHMTFSQWSPSLALLKQLGHHSQLYGRIATGFDTPTTTALARPDGAGGFNNTLRAETSLSYELGLRTNPSPALHTELALFETKINDQLVPFEIEASPGRFAYENSGRSRNRGVETALVLGQPIGWKLQLAYTYSQFKFVDFRDQHGAILNGNRLPGVPEHLANMELHYQSQLGFLAAIETRYTGRYYADNLNHVKVPSSTVSNLRLSYQQITHTWHFNAVLGVNNLFDKSYHDNVRLNATGERYFEPAPPRHGYIGISIGRKL